MKINKDKIQKIVKGASILGGGGGGKLEKAQSLVRLFNKPLDLVSIEELSDEQTILTCFGVGGLKKDGDITKTISNNLEVFQKSTGIVVNGIMPVEMGPVSVLAAGLTSQILKLPLVDGDLVGFRSAPEVYIELITLGKLSRVPLIIGNDKKETLLINGVENLEKVERLLRNFSELSDTKTYVLGYPLKVRDVKQYMGKGSISEAMYLGSEDTEKLNMSYQKIDYALIKSQKPVNKFQGFTAGEYLLQSKETKAIYRIYYKNENLVLIRNKKVFATCPDNIILIDKESGYGINNGSNNIGKSVQIVVSPSIALWRSKKGLKLFSPQNLGFNFEQKIFERLIGK